MARWRGLMFWKRGVQRKDVRDEEERELKEELLGVLNDVIEAAEGRLAKAILATKSLMGR